MSGSYRDIKVWQKSMELVVDIYSCTRSFPKEEMYGLASQLRRAAVSVPSNIAEGKGRRTDRNFSCFCTMRADVFFELETTNYYCGTSRYVTSAEVQRIGNSAGEVAMMLSVLININAISASDRKVIAIKS